MKKLPVLDGNQDNFLVQKVVGLVLCSTAAGKVTPVDPNDHRPALLRHQVPEQ